MQHLQPEDVYPEFPPQPRSLHLHAHDLRQREMGTDYPIYPMSSQPADRPTTVSATQNSSGLPMVMDPRFLANPASALSQHCPPYLSSAPSGLLTGVTHHPTMGFAQGNNLNYFSVLNIESPTRPRQSKKRKRDGDTASRKRKGKITHRMQGGILIRTIYALALSSASSKAGPRPTVDKPTQHLDGISCGEGPSRASELTLLNLSEGPERVNDGLSSHRLSALSVTPVAFHAQHFATSFEQPEGRAKDVWIWFWPVESKELCTPLKDDEPIISLRPKSAAIACRLCWGKKTPTWQVWKNCDGVVTTLRTHLKKKHEDIYEGYRRTGTLETALRQHMGAHIDEPFHLDGLLERILRWMVIDDQVSSISILSFYTLPDPLIVY